MDSDPNYLVSFYKETNSYFSYGGDNLLILPKLNSLISQYDNCLYAVPLPNFTDSTSLVESLLKDESLDDITPNGQNTRRILCILDSNEENLYNGKKYQNRCVVTLGGISRFLFDPLLDQLLVVFTNNIMCIYSLLSDQHDWLYLSLISSVKINNNNKGLSSICVGNNDVYIGLMDGTILVYQHFKFKHSFKLSNSPITLLKPFKQDRLFLCSREGDVYFYSLTQRTILTHFKDHTTFIKSLHFIVTKNNQIGLITLDNDNIVNLWSLTGDSDLLHPSSTPDASDDLLVLVDREEFVRPFKRIIKHDNVASLFVVTTKLSDSVERSRKGSWLLLVVEESGQMYYEDPTDQSILLKTETIYGFGLVKSVEYSKVLIVLLSLNGSILIYNHDFTLLKSLLSNFNNLFQFALLRPSIPDHTNRQPPNGTQTDYYEYSMSWYYAQAATSNSINSNGTDATAPTNNNANGSKLMVVLIGDEVLRILSLNHLNEFIPLGLKNTNHTHKDVITAIYYDHQTNLLLSGSKDKLVILWDLNKLVQLKFINTIYIVTSLLLVTTKLSGSNVVDIVCSSNNVINLYSTKLSSDDSEFNYSHDPQDSNRRLNKSSYTSVIHKLNINYLALSHNQKYISSCSNDKTIVVHHANNLIVKGRCVGHKKSVLYVKFMKLTKTLVSSSMDQTIKIWNLANFTNIKTFQGHTNSIMKILLLENNVQLLSCALDGYIKLWNIPNSDCVQTLNSHENQSVWDIELEGDALYSASNNLIVVYKDASSALIRQKVLEEKEEEIVTSQINSLLLKDNYKESLLLSIKLNNIKLTNNILLKLTNKILFEEHFKVHEDDMEQYGRYGMEYEDVFDYVINSIRAAAEEEKKQLLRNLMNYIKIWITNRKSYFAASILINKILRDLKLDELMKIEGLSDTIEYLLHNLSSHQTRLSNLQEKSYILDIITQHNPVNLNTTTLKDVLYKY